MHRRATARSAARPVARQRCRACLRFPGHMRPRFRSGPQRPARRFRCATAPWCWPRWCCAFPIRSARRRPRGLFAGLVDATHTSLHLRQCAVHGAGGLAVGAAADFARQRGNARVESMRLAHDLLGRSLHACGQTFGGVGDDTQAAPGLRLQHFLQLARQGQHGRALGGGDLLRVVEPAKNFGGLAAPLERTLAQDADPLARVDCGPGPDAGADAAVAGALRLRNGVNLGAVPLGAVSSGGQGRRRPALAAGPYHSRSRVRRRAMLWLCNWQTRLSVTPRTAAISFRFMSCS